ncbi:MAG TPA: flavodoxin domain-containing protein [Candidatus Limnocylindrales bacterium]|nr:flavodoxin domain-containing protein [Candidatus Limnocylindrales bacterium]
MKQILVLYYSRTGNTERMAKAVAEGAQINGDIRVELAFHVDPQELSNFDAIAVGAPTYHHEMPLDFKNLFEEAAVKGLSLKGKVGSAFGSYGWSGEAPRLILEIMKYKFEMQVIEPPLLAKYLPDQKMLASCRDLGKRISENLMSKA